jgi:hypothetical protein
VEAQNVDALSVRAVEALGKLWLHRAVCVAQEAPPTAPAPEAGMYHLAGGASFVRLGTNCNLTDGALSLELRFTKPGTVVATVGINAARPGDFAVALLPDRTPVWQIYRPQVASEARAQDSWHRIARAQKRARCAARGWQIGFEISQPPRKRPAQILAKILPLP